MKRLRPRNTILGGAAIGLIAGAAVYGAVTSGSVSAAPTTFKPAQVSASTDQLPAPVISPAKAAKAANCAAGEKLEQGVCVVYVQKVVVRPAPAVIQAASPVSGRAQDSSPASSSASISDSGSSSSGRSATAVRHEAAESESNESARVESHEAAEVEHAEPAEHQAEAAKDAAERAAESD